MTSNKALRQSLNDIDAGPTRAGWRAQERRRARVARVKAAAMQRGELPPGTYKLEIREGVSCVLTVREP